MFKIGIYCRDPQQVFELDEFVKSFFASQEQLCRVLNYKANKAVLQHNDMMDILLLDMDTMENNIIEMVRKIHMHNMKTCLFCFSKQNKHVDKLLDSAHPFSFLLKPIDGSQLWHQLNDALLYIGPRTSGKAVSYKTDDGMIDLDSDEIYYFEFIGEHKTEIKTNHRIYVTHATLKEALKDLQEMGFESPHKGYVVNMAHIKDVVGNKVHMENGDEIIISQRKLCNFKRLYNDFRQHSTGQ